MSGFLRQSTASQSRLIGPFIDDTDFVTPATGLTIANTDVKLRANGTSLSNKNSGGGTHQVNGEYSLTWDATDTANVGELKYNVTVSGALPVFGVYTVLEEAVYDALFASSAGGYATQASVDAIEAQTDDIGAAGAGLTAVPWNAAWDAEVESEVTDALATMFSAARAEPGQGSPAVNASALAKLDYLYKFARNKRTSAAATGLQVYADDGTTVDHKATVTDDGTTYTRGEFVSGP